MMKAKKDEKKAKITFLSQSIFVCKSVKKLYFSIEKIGLAMVKISGSSTTHFSTSEFSLINLVL